MDEFLFYKIFLLFLGCEYSIFANTLTWQTKKSSFVLYKSGKSGVNEIYKNNYLTKFSNIFLVRTSEQKLSSEDRIVDGAFINITNVPYMASNCIYFHFFFFFRLEKKEKVSLSYIYKRRKLIKLLFITVIVQSK